MMYKSIVIEGNDMKLALEEINQEGGKIVSTHQEMWQRAPEYPGQPFETFYEYVIIYEVKVK